MSSYYKVVQQYLHSILKLFKGHFSLATNPQVSVYSVHQPPAQYISLAQARPCEFSDTNPWM